MKQEFDFLDDFLKEKVESTHFGMKEEYWKKMSALLDEEGKKKKRGFPFWRGLSVIFLLLATSIGAYVVPRFVTKRSSGESETKYEQRELKQTATTTTPKSGEPSTTDQSIKEEKPTTTSNHASTSSAISSVSSSTQKHRTSKKHKHSIQTPSTLPSDATKVLTTFNTPLTVPDPKQHSDSFPVTTKPNPHAKHISSVGSSKQEDQSLASNDHQNDLIPTKVSDVLNSPDATTPAPDHNIHYRNGVAYQPIDTQVIEVRRELNPEESNPRYHADLLKYQSEYIELVTVITSKPISDNTANRTTSSPEKPAPIVPMNEEQNAEWSRSMKLFALAGLNINKGLKGDAETRVKFGVSPFIGFGIEKPLSNELSVSASLGYTYFNGLNQVKRDNYYTYSFGVDSTMQSYYTKKLFQLYLPLSLTYHLSSRQSFTAGIGATYSFGSSGIVQEDLYKPIFNPIGLPTQGKTSTTITPVSTTNAGFQTFDFFLQAGYSYQVVKRLYAQVMMQQGFLDISKNNYYNNSVNNTLTRVSVGVRYNLPSFIKK